MKQVLLIVALIASYVYASVCMQWGNRHVQMFNKKTYDMEETSGDYVFFSYGQELVVQARLSKSKFFGPDSSLLTGVVVLYGGDTFESEGSQLRANHRIALPDALKDAGIESQGHQNYFTIHYKGITITITKHLLPKEDPAVGWYYHSILINVPNVVQHMLGDKLAGLCYGYNMQKFSTSAVRRSFFYDSPRSGRLVNTIGVPYTHRTRPVLSTSARKEAESACQSTGLTNSNHVEHCREDYFLAKDKQAILKAYTKDVQAISRLVIAEKKSIVEQSVNPVAQCKTNEANLRRELEDLKQKYQTELSDLRRLRIQNADYMNSLTRANQDQRMLISQREELRKQVADLNNKMTNCGRFEKQAATCSASIKDAKQEAMNEYRKKVQVENRLHQVEVACRDSTKKLNDELNRIKFTSDICRDNLKQANSQIQSLTQDLTSSKQYQEAYSKEVTRLQKVNAECAAQLQQPNEENEEKTW